MSVERAETSLPDETTVSESTAFAVGCMATLRVVLIVRPNTSSFAGEGVNNAMLDAVDLGAAFVSDDDGALAAAEARVCDRAAAAAAASDAGLAIVSDRGLDFFAEFFSAVGGAAPSSAGAA